jgi:SP family general alpha glucoside:H+ symporter-like MFS transporter
MDAAPSTQDKKGAALDTDTVGPIHPAAEDVDNRKDMSSVIAFAKSASEKEQKMTLMQGVTLYPKAIAWSVLISTCIAMEGYDISLVNNFCTMQLGSPTKTDHVLRADVRRD